LLNEKQDITPRSSFKKLEQRLVLLARLNDQLGYENNRDLLAEMKETDISTPNPIWLLTWLFRGSRF
jgi:hypothetical protein